ncbi:hypothetical protein VTL71DRAFT_15994 [Oculimacula yallundae]|uniref:Uncharacterized protein n=1 Tax=Oculimacula yallundae TaxID=86028 RepID=A0ABR4CEK4_9HELO
MYDAISFSRNGRLRKGEWSSANALFNEGRCSSLGYLNFSKLSIAPLGMAPRRSDIPEPLQADIVDIK